MQDDVSKNQYYFVTKMETPPGMGSGGGEEEVGYNEYVFRTNRTFNNIFYPLKEYHIVILGIFHTIDHVLINSV